MSNHEVGTYMQNAIEAVLELYDNQEISQKNTYKLISSFLKIVWEYDGNTYEATEYLDKARCGKCLRKMLPGEPLYALEMLLDEPDVFDFMKKPGDRYEYDILSHIHDASDTYLLTTDLCTECFDSLFAVYDQNPHAGEIYRRFIQEHCPPELWHTK